MHSGRLYVLRQARYLETLLHFISSISSELFRWQVVRMVLGALEETPSAEARPMLGPVVPPGRYSSPSAAAVTVGTARGWSSSN